jgi:Na+-transporting NADH:ubiquinone oxidoreductase subunit NqrE
MIDFSFYFKWGLSHIINFSALDHLLFLLALTAVYFFENIKQLIVLITAFTIGHSITLVLSINNLIQINSEWIEFFIAFTILFTSLFNFYNFTFQSKEKRLKYILAMFFGLIHGMGFAEVIKMTLASAKSIFLPMLSFNLGVEAGQLFFVLIIIGFSQIIVYQLGFSKKWWIRLVSGISFCGGIYFAINSWPF